MKKFKIQNLEVTAAQINAMIATYTCGIGYAEIFDTSGKAWNARARSFGVSLCERDKVGIGGLPRRVINIEIAELRREQKRAEAADLAEEFGFGNIEIFV